MSIVSWEEIMDINELDEITSYELNDFLNSLNRWEEIEILEDWEYQIWQDSIENEIQ
jgi:hypothetical protein